MKQPKKILITGANGFIGGALYEYFSKRDDFSVIGLVKHEDSYQKFIQCNLSEMIDLNEDADIIIHAAGRSPSRRWPVSRYVRDNIYSAMNLIEYAKNHKTEKIIYLGAVSSYGEVSDVLTEDSPRIEVSEYGQTKLIGETLIGESSVSNMILILPGVVGYGCHANWLMNCAEQIYRNENVFFYNGEAYFNNVVEVNDVCEFVLKLLLEEEKGVISERVLLATKDKMRVKDVLQYIKRKFKSNSKLIEQNKGQKSFIIDTKKAIERGFVSKKLPDILDIVVDETKRRCTLNG